MSAPGGSLRSFQRTVRGAAGLLGGATGAVTVTTGVDRSGGPSEGEAGGRTERSATAPRIDSTMTLPATARFMRRVRMRVSAWPMAVGGTMVVGDGMSRPCGVTAVGASIDDRVRSASAGSAAAAAGGCSTSFQLGSAASSRRRSSTSGMLGRSVAFFSSSCSMKAATFAGTLGSKSRSGGGGTRMCMARTSPSAGEVKGGRPHSI